VTRSDCGIEDRALPINGDLGELSVATINVPECSWIPRPAKRIVSAAVLGLYLAGCNSEGGPGPNSEATANVFGPGPTQLVTVPVQVPVGLRTVPFDVPRSLTIPKGFSIQVYARVPRARFLAVTPDGRLLVSRPSTGSITLLRPNGGGLPLATTFVSGMQKPHDMVFYQSAGVMYLYVAQSNKVVRAVYQNGDLTMRPRQTIVSGLPDAFSPGLGGQYGHELKNIALDPLTDRLYVSIGSTCNVLCVNDTKSNPVRASIYVYSSDGTGGRLFARGIRNAEGLALVPVRDILWAVVNNRDDIPYPFDDGTGNYGRVFPSFVDDHPPELFINVRDGGNYGWPFCNSNPDTPSGFNNMPLDPDFDTTRNRTVRCDTMTKAMKGIPAHSAPLGLTFAQRTRFPQYYRRGALVALHGSWNRSVARGPKVAYFSWDPLQRPGPQYDFVTGWVSGGRYWGRPVDTAVDSTGALLISDDQSGTIYRVWQTGAIP
jgi:glucose/arabinose dehydrogenase